MKESFSLIIHGGAGSLEHLKREGKGPEIMDSVRRILAGGRHILENGGTALDAVEHCAAELEDDPLYNAGRGSVLNEYGEVEMDAAIMDGSNLKAGAVAAVQSVKNPIELCRYIMNNSKHVMLAGTEALKYAKKKGLEIRDKEYFYDEFRFQQFLFASIAQQSDSLIFSPLINPH